MKLQEILENRGIDLSKTKLLRHNITDKDVSGNLKLGYLDLYQSIQSPKKFDNSNTIVSFLGTEGTNGVLLGCYNIKEEPYNKQLLPKGYIDSNPEKERVFYKMVKIDGFSDMENRLVIDWGKSAISWCQNGTTEKEVLRILPTVSEIIFSSYENVVLSFQTLEQIVSDPKAHSKWKDKLSVIGGVYLITDTETGKHYVGSASGLEGGIWGRWSDYVHTKHGGNKGLKQLIDGDPKHCDKFQFSILEVFPLKKDAHDILEYEQLYKKKLCTREFGLNDN